ncbi:MAG: CBS domain-containing protein [Pirellulales bacterium]|nr:CBS domain-containing protein [Pirellulales bacterium]
MPTSAVPFQAHAPQRSTSTLSSLLLAAALLGVAALGLEGVCRAIWHQPAHTGLPVSGIGSTMDDALFSARETAADSTQMSRWLGAARSTVLGLLCIVSLIAVVRAYQPRQARPAVPAAQQACEIAEHIEAAYIAKRQELRARLAEAARSGTKLPLTVQDFMSRPPLSVSPAMTTESVAAFMQRERIRHVLVCDSELLLGVISDRDLYRAGGRTVAECMSPHPIKVTPDTSLTTAASLMLANRINCLPVCDGQRVVGIMTTVDMTVAMQCLMALVEDLMTQHGWKVAEGAKPAGKATSVGTQPQVAAAP